MICRFSVMMRCGLMFSRGEMMMLGRFVFGFHWHLKFLLKTKPMTLRGKVARLVSATKFPLRDGPRWSVRHAIRQ